MKTLNDVIEERGRESLKELLKNELIITEKINGHRLIIKKKANGKVDFFTKKSKQPIGVLENVMSDLYLDAMNYILKNKDRIPTGETSFYLVKNDLDIEYTDVKSQALLLTNTRNRTNLSLKETAELAGFRAQEEIFNGFLNDEQIESIINYINSDQNLPELFSKLFGTNVNSLNKDVSDIIEGYIFDIQGELYKLEDNRFEKKEFKKINTSNYELLVIDILDFFNEFYIDNLNIYQTKKDFRYLEIISYMLVDYIKEKANNELDFFTTLPTFSENTGKVNTKYLANKEAKSYIINNPKYEYLFRVLLQLFKRDLAARGLITDEICSKHAVLRSKIENRSSKIGMPTFEEAINLK